MYFVYMGEVMKMLYQYPFDYRRGISMDPAMCCVNLYGHDYRLTQQEYLLFDELLKSALTSCSRGQPVRAFRQIPCVPGRPPDCQARAARARHEPGRAAAHRLGQRVGL